MQKIKCDNCKKTFTAGNQPNGMPNGVGFVKDGKVISWCYDCICKLGKEVENDKNQNQID